jgi:large subunit ribosomal protein L6
VSRIGKMPVVVPDKVQVKIEDSVLRAKGPLGELSVHIPEGVSYNIQDDNIIFDRKDNNKKNRALHGLTRMLCANAITGVNTGFVRTLIIEGVGFRTEMKGTKLQLNMGFSHPILFIPPPGISFETPSPTTVKVKGIDKQVVGLVAAKIRAIRPPEPYKGKGIRFEGEYVRRKAGKTAAK